MPWRCVSSVVGLFPFRREYYPDVASRASVKTTSNESSAAGAPSGASTATQLHPCGSSNCFRASRRSSHRQVRSQSSSVRPALCANRIARPGPFQRFRAKKSKASRLSIPWRAQVSRTWLLAQDLSDTGLLCGFQPTLRAFGCCALASGAPFRPFLLHYSRLAPISCV